MRPDERDGIIFLNGYTDDDIPAHLAGEDEEQPAASAGGRAGGGCVIAEGMGPTASGNGPDRRPGSSRPIPIRLVSSRATRASTSSSSVPGYSVDSRRAARPLGPNVPTHNGRAAGTIAGIPASATWKNGDNYYIYPDVPSDLTDRPRDSRLNCTDLPP